MILTKLQGLVRDIKDRFYNIRIFVGVLACSLCRVEVMAGDTIITYGSPEYSPVRSRYLLRYAALMLSDRIGFLLYPISSQANALKWCAILGVSLPFGDRTTGYVSVGSLRPGLG